MTLEMDFLLVHGKMKDKIIVTINKLEDTIKLKELGISKFAFPLKGFTVGMPNTFLVSEINTKGYLFINRILDNNGIIELKKILNNLSDNIIGIIFDDLGIIELTKDLKLEKILYLSHFNTNYESSKIYLEYVDSVILSTDITKEETEYIVNKLPNKVTLFVYGLVGVMYSRRKLIDNYSKYYNIPKINPLLIENTNHEFLLYENEYGTYFYHDKIFNGKKLLDLNALYFFINSAFITPSFIERFLSSDNVFDDEDEGFLYTETIYKLKGDLDD